MGCCTGESCALYYEQTKQSCPCECFCAECACNDERVGGECSCTDADGQVREACPTNGGCCFWCCCCCFPFDCSKCMCAKMCCTHLCCSCCGCVPDPELTWVPVSELTGDTCCGNCGGEDCRNASACCGNVCPRECCNVPAFDARSCWCNCDWGLNYIGVALTAGAAAAVRASECMLAPFRWLWWKLLTPGVGLTLCLYLIWRFALNAGVAYFSMESTAADASILVLLASLVSFVVVPLLPKAVEASRLLCAKYRAKLHEGCCAARRPKGANKTPTTVVASRASAAVELQSAAPDTVIVIDTAKPADGPKPVLAEVRDRIASDLGIKGSLVEVIAAAEIELGIVAAPSASSGVGEEVVQGGGEVLPVVKEAEEAIQEQGAEVVVKEVEEKVDEEPMMLVERGRRVSEALDARAAGGESFTSGSAGASESFTSCNSSSSASMKNETEEKV